MNKIVTHREINDFLERIENIYPNFVAGVIADHHGFPIASKVPKNFPIGENELALYAVVNQERDFLKNINYIKVKRSLSKDKKIKLLLLLDKNNQYIYGFKKLKATIRRKTNPF